MQLSAVCAQVAIFSWANVGPSSALTLGQHWLAMLAHRGFVHRYHVAPTLAVFFYFDVGPTLGQHQLR